MVGEFLGMVAEQQSERCKDPRVPVSDELPRSTDPDEERCNEHVSNRVEGSTAKWVNDERNSKRNLKAEDGE
jgi:hypothetical protein